MEQPRTAPTLTDGVVTLRPVRESDAPRVLEQCTDPVSLRWTQVPDGYTLEQAAGFAATAAGRWADGSEWVLAVEHEGRFGGSVALRPHGGGLADIGYGAHPGVRGTGAMERAVRLLLGWGFGSAGLGAVEWRARAGNWASRRLAWRVGFSFDGVLRGTHRHRGELVDGWIGSLLSGEPLAPRHRWLDTPVLEGDGVRLRPLRDDDVPRIVEACSDPGTAHWLGGLPSPYTEAEARAWLESCREGAATDSRVTWAVADPGTDVLLGAVNVFDVHAGTGEIGYWTHPGARGRGLTTAAARRVVAWAFDDLGLRLLRGVAAVDNAASRHVLESVAMRPAGTGRLGTTLRDGPADVVRYDLLATEVATTASATAWS